MIDFLRELFKYSLKYEYNPSFYFELGNSRVIPNFTVQVERPLVTLDWGTRQVYLRGNPDVSVVPSCIIEPPVAPMVWLVEWPAAQEFLDTVFNQKARTSLTQVLALNLPGRGPYSITYKVNFLTGRYQVHVNYPEQGREGPLHLVNSRLFYSGSIALPK